MTLLYVVMVIICLLIVIIYKRPFDVYNRFVLIFDKFKQCLLLSIKMSHLRILINFCLSGVIKHLRLSTIKFVTHLISNPHQSNLQLQALVGGLIIYDVLQKIVFQKHGLVVMF